LRKANNGGNESRRSRWRFTDEFKRRAVRLVLDEGKSVTAVARELELGASALGQWGKQAWADPSKGRHRPDDRRARVVVAATSTHRKLKLRPKISRGTCRSVRSKTGKCRSRLEASTREVDRVRAGAGHRLVRLVAPPIVLLPDLSVTDLHPARLGRGRLRRG
jgi:transposase-like protein